MTDYVTVFAVDEIKLGDATPLRFVWHILSVPIGSTTFSVYCTPTVSFTVRGLVSMIRNV